jgi:tetratricopeptide (TPR) repeat protein
MLAEANRLSAENVYESMAQKENVAYLDDLQEKYRGRLRQAQDLYDEVIDRYRGRSPSQLTRLDELYVKLSYFRKADAVYDLSKVSELVDLALFSEAAEAYDRAAWVYQKDPMAMSAYVQMINCYLRLGDARKARMTLERARWALKQIDDVAFAAGDSSENRAYWEDYWSWLASTPVFTPMDPQERNS